MSNTITATTDTTASATAPISLAAAPDSSRYVLGYRPVLDGIRGIMPFGVLAAHVVYEWFPGAIVFMNIFFMLSAYLITSLLLRDIQRHGHIRFKQFYIRRVLRLFPANYAMIILLTIPVVVLLPDVASHLKQSAAAALYISNWTRAFEVPMTEWLGHTWSLSIEEQYYLAWPLVFSLLVKRFGVTNRTVAIVLALAATSALWRLWLERHGAPQVRLYNGTDVRADTLLIGCALAMLLSLEWFRDSPLVLAVTRHALLPIALTLFIVLGFTLNWEWRGLYSWATPLIDTSIAVFLAGLVLHRETLVHRFFENKVLVFLGRMSYSTYLLHYPIFYLLRTVFDCGTWGVLFIGFPVTYGMAYLFYRFIETPFLEAKVRFQ